jgi:AcrR family transcriptional regulator
LSEYNKCLPTTARPRGHRQVRRTQAERRAATRDRLLDATIDCIADRGYAAASTTEIVRRAGVSRGAQVHHYPTKAALVVAALDQLFAQRLVEFESAFAALPDEDRRPDVAIDVLWTMFQGRTFEAWLELTVAARTDRDLRARLIEVDKRFDEGVQESFQRAFPGAEANDMFDPAVAVRFAFTVLTGAALNAVVGDDTDAQEAIASLKFISNLLLPDAWRPST